jgi:hypothetical protein
MHNGNTIPQFLPAVFQGAFPEPLKAADPKLLALKS